MSHCIDVPSSLASRFRPQRPRWGTLYGRRLAYEAAAWLRDNLAEPLTIGDLCRALNARERTLHSAFYEHMGTTPKAYSKVLRLTAARSDLLQADRGTRVTDVALRWGFLHFGWFSHDYRQSFGETPSATLRRGDRLSSGRAAARASGAAC